MATKTIAWDTGGGYITLTYSGAGNAFVSVTSDANDSFDAREQSVRIATTAGSPSKAIDLLIRQKGKTYPIGEVFNFGYTGSVQQITLPKGKYKLQCWGAQGGNVSGSYTQAGSKGGYSEGILTLTKTTTLYVFVGGKGTDSSTSSTSGTANGGWNGGGASVRKSSYDSGGEYGISYPRPGGGATDISLVTSSMSYSNGRTNRSSASLLSRFIVAGGGAGASARYTEIEEEITSWVDYTGGTFTRIAPHSGFNNKYTCTTPRRAIAAGRYKMRGSGPLSGTLYIEFYNGSTWLAAGSSEIVTAPSGTTEYIMYYITNYTTNVENDASEFNYTIQVEETNTSTSTSSGKSNASQQGGGTSGKGQYPGTQTSAGSGGSFGLGANQTTTNYRYCSGAGGGGWYGGGCGESDSSTSYVNYSGGGSGFVNTAANAGSRPSGYTGLQLDSGTTYAGNSSFPSPSGGNETGHSGNGYARITVLA